MPISNITRTAAQIWFVTQRLETDSDYIATQTAAVQSKGGDMSAHTPREINAYINALERCSIYITIHHVFDPVATSILPVGFHPDAADTDITAMSFENRNAIQIFRRYKRSRDQFVDLSREYVAAVKQEFKVVDAEHIPQLMPDSATARLSRTIHDARDSDICGLALFCILNSAGRKYEMAERVIYFPDTGKVVFYRGPNLVEF